MSLFSKLFFISYNFIWSIATPFLRRNKRLKDGWEQRNIPVDWLAQNFVVFNNTLIELEKDKLFFGEKIYRNQFEHDAHVPNEFEPNTFATAEHVPNEFKSDNFATVEHVIEHESNELIIDNATSDNARNATVDKITTDTNTTDKISIDVYDVDLWIQAASGGESYLACEFIKALPPHNRAISILITTWTRQGMQVLEQECAKIIENWKEEASQNKNQEGAEQEPQIPYIQIRFAALDRIDIVRRALDMANPRLCIMLETELWPNFMLVCKEKNIPLYVVNARMTKTSYEFYTIIASVLDFITPKHILATTKDDMARFSDVFPSALVSYMPNIKFDRAAESVRHDIAKMCEKEKVHQDDSALGMGKIICQKLEKQVYVEPEEVMEPEEANKQYITHIQETSTFEIETYVADTCTTKIYTEEKHKSESILNEYSKIESILNEYSKSESSSYAAFNRQDGFENKAYLNVLPMLFSKVQHTFLFASVREEEESLLASILWKVYPAKKDSLFIVVPRHLHRVQSWVRRFYDLGMPVVLASEFLQEKQESNEFEAFESHSCVVWDIFGDLPHLYSHVDSVFVGGSFKGLGGQNFLEALSCGIVPHVGPDLNNFLWAIGDDFPPSLKNIGLLYQHANKRELQATLLAIKSGKLSAKDRFDVQVKFLEWLENRCGASQLAVEKVMADKAFREFTS